ncbi:hypothetical protein DNX69_20930 [Rhodopseudomonas palustris]|uniref:Uncharacterized protein n=1 Tax=Rhodopseudomonas palustris TaxID=1076 RepID=A0A323UC19_RHOPL|nr:hypothetical protein DNX69_20930 [Rhodopseudomonas palustris]
MRCRHCEERSDEAIQRAMRDASRLLRCARNDLQTKFAAPPLSSLHSASVRRSRTSAGIRPSAPSVRRASSDCR